MMPSHIFHLSWICFNCSQLCQGPTIETPLLETVLTSHTPARSDAHSLTDFRYIGLLLGCLLGSMDPCVCVIGSSLVSLGRGEPLESMWGGKSIWEKLISEPEEKGQAGPHDSGLKSDLLSWGWVTGRFWHSLLGSPAPILAPLCELPTPDVSWTYRLASSEKNMTKVTSGHLQD